MLFASYLSKSYATLIEKDGGLLAEVLKECVFVCMQAIR